jgi:hypothetical protein
VPVEERALMESLRRYYFFGNAVRHSDRGVYKFIESCIPLAIFEVTLANLDTRFQMSEFTQPMPGTPPKKWQVA